MTDCKILTLVDRLERCSLGPAEFHHRDHLTVAVVYLYCAELERALDKMRATLLRFVAHHGGNRYHETATRFWMLQAEKHLDRTLCLQHAVERVTAALADKNLIYLYYSRELLDSVDAKQRWVTPDLIPFTLRLVTSLDDQ
ncbi:MAG TPA: hypothetical protein VI685_16800 [Candidatus Angelobacter sp.]